MKMFLVLGLTFLSAVSFANKMNAADYNEQRAIALVDAKFLGEREMLGLSMDRYRIIGVDKGSKNILVGVSAPGGECTVQVKFKGEVVEILERKCQPGS